MTQRGFGCADPPLLGAQRTAQRLGLGHARVQLLRRHEQRLDARAQLCHGHVGQGPLVQVGAAQSQVGRREAGIRRHRLLEQGDGLLVGLDAAFLQQIQSHEIPTVRGRVVRAACREASRRFARQADLEVAGHGARDVLLHLDGVGHRPIVIRRPEVIAAARIDELHRDAHMVGIAPHRPFQHVCDAELRADLADIHRLPLERECRGAGHHPQRRNLRQPVRQFLGHAVAEGLLGLLRGHVHEGQHHDGG